LRRAGDPGCQEYPSRDTATLFGGESTAELRRLLDAPTEIAVKVAIEAPDRVDRKFARELSPAHVRGR
jgi:hypothetical protein